MRPSPIVRVVLVGLCLLGGAATGLADKVPTPPAPAAAPAPTAAPAAAPAPAPTAAPAPAAPQPDAEGFVPESRPPNMNASVDQNIPAAPLVATAYGFIWLVVIGFVLFTLRRTQRIEADIAELRDRIEGGRK